MLIHKDEILVLDVSHILKVVLMCLHFFITLKLSGSRTPKHGSIDEYLRLAKGDAPAGVGFVEKNQVEGDDTFLLISYLYMVGIGNCLHCENYNKDKHAQVGNETAAVKRSLVSAVEERSNYLCNWSVCAAKGVILLGRSRYQYTSQQT